ncbi:MAG TPA: diaminopimelate decarboxylase [Candidatus Saccharimonadia bacterium]|nr:diaminopimelate decarboxylase [Candidatus Saccharimonadia bacterium]
MSETLTPLPPLTVESKLDLRALAEEHMQEGGLFVYEKDVLRGAANSLLELEMPFGLTVRYAAKANPHRQIIRLFDGMGLHFDASSVQEALELIREGVDPSKISLSSQILRENRQLGYMIGEGLRPVATSLRQIEMLGRLGCDEIAVRVNPGKGYGHNNRTNVGGSASSFGIWHELLPSIKIAAQKADVSINRLHTHIGSGADPAVWREVIQKSLGIAERLPDVETLDIGGGYKVARMPDEDSTDVNEVGSIFAEELQAFADRTGRELRLEMEPGTLLVANAGKLAGRIEEIVRTDVYEFLKLNVGMNALIRPSMYGAQHPIEVLNNSKSYKPYVVVGPCCESGDILTPAPRDSEGIRERVLKKAHIGDIVVIGGAGAYAKTMAASSYNHIPPPTEIFR